MQDKDRDLSAYRLSLAKKLSQMQGCVWIIGFTVIA